MLTHEPIRDAATRIAPYVRRTPTALAARLSRETGCEVFLKLECHQLSGSFKVRGAFNKLLRLAPEVRAKGVVAASTGNHGSAIAIAAERLECPALVFVPQNADPGKLAAIEAQGAELVRGGSECAQAEAAARAHAEEQGLVYVSPYNDLDVMAGQGTLAIEIEEDLGSLDALFVAVGGGGLAAGIGAWFARCEPRPELIGVSPGRSAAMHAAIEAGRIVDVPHENTLADATAGGLEAQALTFPLCREHLDELLLVDEDEIAAQMRRLVADEHLLVEGAAGAALAGFVRLADRYRGGRVAVVVCGANVGIDVLAGVLATAR